MLRGARKQRSNFQMMIFKKYTVQIKENMPYITSSHIPVVAHYFLATVLQSYLQGQVVSF